MNTMTLSDLRTLVSQYDQLPGNTPVMSSCFIEHGRGSISSCESVDLDIRPYMAEDDPFEYSIQDEFKSIHNVIVIQMSGDSEYED